MELVIKWLLLVGLPYFVHLQDIQCPACSTPDRCMAPASCCGEFGDRLAEKYEYARVLGVGIWCQQCSVCPETCWNQTNCRLTRYVGDFFCFCFPDPTP